MDGWDSIIEDVIARFNDNYNTIDPAVKVILITRTHKVPKMMHESSFFCSWRNYCLSLVVISFYRFSTDVANVPTLLDILLVLPEEINNRKFRIGNNRRARLTEIMTNNCRTVLELLLASLNHWPDDMDIKTRVGWLVAAAVTMPF